MSVLAAREHLSLFRVSCVRLCLQKTWGDGTWARLPRSINMCPPLFFYFHPLFRTLKMPSYLAGDPLHTVICFDSHSTVQCAVYHPLDNRPRGKCFQLCSVLCHRATMF